MNPIEGDDYFDVTTTKSYRFHRGEWYSTEYKDMTNKINKIIYFSNKRICHYEILEIVQHLYLFNYDINYIFEHIKKV